MSAMLFHAAISALVAIAFFGCASSPAPAPILLPPAADVDALVPPRETPPPDVSPDAVNFPDTPVTNCGPGPGVLLSERSYSYAILDKSGRRRAEAESRALRELRRSERAAYQTAFDSAYREATQAREREAKAQAYRPWVFVAGVLAGGIVATVVATAAAEGAR